VSVQQASPPIAPPPWPLVKLWRHPLRWLLNKVHLLIALVIFAYIGTLIVVALYYLLFEVNPTMTHWWHQAVPNSDLRHSVRDVAEGVLGGLLAQQVIWNHFKKRKPINKLDEVEIAAHIPNLKRERRMTFWEVVTSPPLVLLYATPGFFAAYGIVHLIQHFHHLPGVVALLHPHSSSLWVKTQHTFTDAWPRKVMGYSAALFFGRRPAKAVFDHMQLIFAERQVALGKNTRWYQPPTYQARINSLKAQGTIAKEHQSLWQTVSMFAVVLVGLGLAGYGWYILNYIAS
jgi:hypothetical protein